MKIAIIGTRTPTPDQSIVCKVISSIFSEEGHTIISGGAEGIDYIALSAAKNAEIILPWSDYNEELLKNIKGKREIYDEAIHHKWTQSVYDTHPNPKALTKGAIRLHARNYGIIKNADLVLAFPSPQGGGTAQGIRQAKKLGKKVFVFPEDYEKTLEEVCLYIENEEKI